MGAREVKKAVASAFADVFEQLAFMTAELCDDTEEVGALDGPWVEARIAFNAPYEGYLRVLAPEQLCRELAAILLGIDQASELAQEAGYDAIKEVLNIASGRTLENLAGHRAELDLTVPEITPALGVFDTHCAPGELPALLWVEGYVVLVKASLKCFAVSGERV